MQTHPETIAGDRLDGAEAIAAFLGVSPRRVRYLIDSGKLPIARESDRAIVGSRQVLNDWWRGLHQREVAPPAKL